MKKKKMMTGQQIKFIINMVSLAIFAFSYFNIYTNYVEKTEAAYQEIDMVQKSMDIIEKKIAEEDTVVQNSLVVNSEVQVIIDSYPVDVSKVDGYMFIEQMEKTLNINFTSTNVTDGTAFYETILPIRNEDGTEIEQEVASATTTEPTTGTTVVGDTTVTNDASGSSSQTAELDNVDSEIVGDTSNSSQPAENETVAPKLQTMTGLQSTITMNFQTTYQGFKKLVKYINDYPEKTVIDSVTISSDNTTGKLTGSLVLKRFALTGTGKVYEAPIIDDISIGTDNIFGTDSGVNEEVNSIDEAVTDTELQEDTLTQP